MKQNTYEIPLHPVTALTFLLAAFMFIKNGWITEDAYIFFRSLEQLFAGNGPRWNPHERVQVFTSPLWFWLLAGVRAVSSNLYLNALGVSFALFAATLLIIHTLFRKPATLLLAMLLLLASSGFFDFTTSGLENPLAYFLLTLYALNYHRLFGAAAGTPNTYSDRHALQALLIISGLLLLVRHDLILLVLPSILYAVKKTHTRWPRQELLVTTCIALAPFILWSLFALIYYGTPLPNTAYAKLNTGISRVLLLVQGAKYVAVSLRHDSLTLPLIAGALLYTFRSGADRHLIYLGCGIILNLLYVVYIGGDFMQGRFFSYAYLLGVLLLLWRYQQIRSPYVKPLLWVGLGLYLVLYPNAPFNARPDHTNTFFLGGVVDERGCYFDSVSLYRYVRVLGAEEIFPYNDACSAGAAFKEAPEPVGIRNTIGMYGYHAGLEKIIVDPWALSDPLLARLPALDGWRIGHFERQIPAGYLASIAADQAMLADPQLNAFYQKIKLVTQSEPLFTWERCKAILFLNLGFYDHYLSGNDPTT